MTFSPHSDSPYAWIESSLASLHRVNWYRSVRPLDSSPGPIIHRQGQDLINFASNDYLGLANHPDLKQAAIAAIQAHGTGSTGSRLVSGHRELHAQLEGAIATWKQTEAALVFSSGYLANLSTIKALVDQRDLIIADAYNHSSLQNGAILSGANTLTYPHGDFIAAEQLLAEHRASFRRCLMITDGVFSMDGDCCPLPELLALAEQFQAMVLVDDAHGIGVLGQKGRGVTEALLNDDAPPFIQVGTLSKALGSLGGYVAASHTVIEFLRNRAPGWIYTTGLSPADTAAALAGVALAQDPTRRQSLWANMSHLQQRLQEKIQGDCIPLSLQGQPLTLTPLPTASAICCLQVGDPKDAIALSQHLINQGIWVPAIRPPTVPTSRLRISLMATHTMDQIDQLVAALDSAAN
jgi:8-amino-7-oxononanoate synthase